MRNVKLFIAPDQAEIINCASRNLGLFAGRRYGKTKTVMVRMIKRCLQQPRFVCWYITPGYAQCKEVYEELVDLSVKGKLFKRYHMQPFPKIYFKNGSELSFRSFEKPDYLRGTGVHEVWVDEIQQIKEKEFWKVIKPLVADYQGTIGVAGQFRGKNWYYKEFCAKGLVGTPRYKAWIKRSADGIMFQTISGKEELEQHRLALPKVVWDQEYDCIPAASFCRVFPDDQLQAIIRSRMTTKDSFAASLNLNNAFIAGLDLGRVVSHTAMVVLNANTNTIVHAERFPLGMKHSEYAKKAGQIAKHFNCPVVVDTTGGASGGHRAPDEYVKFYRREIPDMHSFYWGVKNKEAIVAHLALAIQNNEITIPIMHHDLIEELEHYEYEEKGHGTYYSYHAEDGYQSDLVSALAQSVWGVKCGWVKLRNSNRTSLSAIS
jgi:hypothetical protein